MNQVIKNLIKDFVDSEEISESDIAKNFENFCIFSVVSIEHRGNFSIEDISMGNTEGIDGLAIIVNGSLVTTIEEIEDLVKRNNYLEASYIFIQAKTSNKFDGADISNFFNAIKDFFSEKPTITQANEIRRAIQLNKKIWEYIPKMIKEQPICNIYYITTGKWQDDRSLLSRIEKHKSELDNLSLFEKVNFTPCGAKEIQQLYLETKRSTSCKFIFDSSISLPVEKDVEEAYSGIVEFNEFKKIIMDENGKMKDVFYENVRNFLGENIAVNIGIENTLKNKEFDIFCLLNNGVTIVADSKVSKGKEFYIENYQIVNGCQTSYVLFENKNLIGIEQINIPLKLIITEDEDIRNKIIVATNSQTAIPKEQLEAFTEFQKDLELYYDYIEPEDAKLFYERRQKQYRNKNVSRPRIVTIREQIKTFTSMFLNQPHLASGYFSKVYNNNKGKMFKESHKFYPYYISSLAMYKLEHLFKTRDLDREYRVARYHILMILRMLITNGIENIPRFNSKKMDKYCEKIKNTLLNNNKTKEYFNKSLEILDSIESIDLGDQKTLYTSENTRKLKEKIEQLISN